MAGSIKINVKEMLFFIQSQHGFHDNVVGIKASKNQKKYCYLYLDS